MDVTFFSSAAAFRDWLEDHHATATECWVGLYKKNSGRAGIGYAEAVDEALCFGWIDGVRMRMDESSYTIRFTPRRSGSVWSVKNIERVGELSRLGRMHEAGVNAFDERNQANERLYSYEETTRSLDEVSERAFRSNGKAWEFFKTQPPSYQRAVNWWVMSAKREETKRRRLSTLIKTSEQGRRLRQFSRRSSGTTT